MRAAIVLGGGRSRRMGTDKLALLLDGRPVLERVVTAALGWADAVVIAGDRPDGWRDDARVGFRREDPPFGGPVAGIAAALEIWEGRIAGRVGRGQGGLPKPGAEEAPLGGVRPGEVMLLAGDLADPDAVVHLLAGAAPGVDGVVLEDDEGWPQYLAGRYRTEALAAAVRDLAQCRDVSVRRLLGGLDLARVRAPQPALTDLDTPEVAKLWGAKAPHLR
ncbi:MAG: NTP transferase domain-containing protein [Propioniciclava sp.]|uniref:molybdenum cofactor guanylyltransferase n=1 Tax=Propioniciclava sp. TaxID=2038686 RepID=UPI0039E5FD81